MTFARFLSIIVLLIGLTACATSTKAELESAVGAVNKVENRSDSSVQPKNWTYVLSPINVGTEDPEGNIYIWHTRTGSDKYPTEKTCMDAAKISLEYLGGEAWNFEARCSPAHNAIVPISIISSGEVEFKK